MTNKFRLRAGFFVIAVLCCNFIAVKTMAQNSAHISIKLSKEKGPMLPIWAWFGYDEPNYTYMKDGRKLLSEIAALSPVPVYVRTHNLLTSGDGTPALKWGSTNAYTEDSAGNPVYNWRILDSIFDTYIKRGMKPLAQIGFMPEALSIKPQPYRHNWQPGVSYTTIETGWAYPPKDYKKWAALVYNWVTHCIERYGKNEVESWYWEVWNEPDGVYWKAAWEEFFKLYDYAADAVKRALPTARIGGPDVTGGGMKFLDAFLKHCTAGTNYVTGNTGSPLDMVLFHAKGSPKVVDGRVRMDMGRQLRNIVDNFNVIMQYAGVKGLPVIIGESDPEGCAACSMQTNPENAYRNGTVYSSYTAAALAREYALANRFNMHVIGAVNWSFEFENQPWFAGFRDLATNGVDKPILNVFRMFGKMKGTLVEAESDNMYLLDTVVASSIRGQRTDVGAVASKDKNSAAIMVWNYHDDDIDTGGTAVDITVHDLPAGQVTVTQLVTDKTHSNSYEAWKKMGSPQQPTAAQIAQLEKAGMLQTAGRPQKISVLNGRATIPLMLPRQGVALVKINW